MERTCGFIRTLTRLYRRLHGRQTRIFQFSSTLRVRKVAVAALPPLPPAVKLHFPAFLRSERRKTGSCSFTAALIGGKVDFPVFLRSERRKTGNCTYAAGTCVGDLSIRFFNPLFPSFACWWVMGRGVVPQNEGRTCVNNDWVK